MSMHVKLNKLERAPSLKERAYQGIKHIILHNLSGGDPLIVEDLAAQLDTSRTPVREALLALELEGLVYSVPNRGTFVANPCTEEVGMIYQIREVLEPMAVKLATSRIPDDELEKLKLAFDAAQKAIEAGDFDPYLQCDADFHRLILLHTGNQILTQLIENLEDRVYRLRMLARKKSTNHLVQAHKEHRTVLDALIERDADKAEQLMRTHLQKGGRRVEEILMASDVLDSDK